MGPRPLASGLLVLAILAGGCARPRATVPIAPGAGWTETGHASWYGVPYHGRRTASGEVYDMHQMTAAHRTLPFGTWIAVERLGTGAAAEVRINDRGPFVDGRILDLSYAAARALDAVGPGVIPVRLRVVDEPDRRPAPPRLSFTVQVGAFADAERARALQQEVVALGWEARVEPATTGDGLVYRVRVGRFPDRAEADAAARALAARDRAVLVVAE